jgi:hypothetical protein
MFGIRSRKVTGRQLNYIMHEADRTAIKKITRTHIQAVSYYLKTLNWLAIAPKINRYGPKEMQFNERYTLILPRLFKNFNAKDKGTYTGMTYVTNTIRDRQ